MIDTIWFISDMEIEVVARPYRKNIDIKDLDDANLAGTSFSWGCTLILIEGIATKSLAVAGLGVVGRDKFGLYPLKHKFINVRKQKESDIKGNEDVINIMDILGLKWGQKYETEEELQTLRYGRVMLMMDRDEDGIHAKGLIINFFHCYWPSLICRPFLTQFITPLARAFRDDFEKSFYQIDQFETFLKESKNTSYSLCFYRSLESFTPEEIRKYFTEIDAHVVDFSYRGFEDDEAIILAFDKNKENDRKQWIADLREESFIYYDGIREITYRDFIKKELLLYSDLHNERSIPSVVDGLNRTQRKVLYTFFKKNIFQVNLLQLIGSIFEVSGYRQGENSLGQTIINMGQDFVGSNNINLLLPIGQFGTRIHGGKDAGKPKFLHTRLNNLTKLLFPEVDNSILDKDKRNSIEPAFYIPIIPLILVNGAGGIGTGWKTKIPNYKPLDIINNIYRIMDNVEPTEMTPWYRNFKGSINKNSEKQFRVCGILSVRENGQIQISELPVGEWTQNYKEKVLSSMLKGSEDAAPSILYYEETHTDTTVNFLITPADKLKNYTEEQLYQEFKLQKLMYASYVAFSPDGNVMDYENPIKILKQFYHIRLELYEKRRIFLIKNLEKKLENIQKLVALISQDEQKELITIQNPTRSERVYIKRECDGENYDFYNENTLAVQNHGSFESYDFLSDIWHIAERKLRDMNRECKNIQEELKILENLKAVDMWKKELDMLSKELAVFFRDPSYVNEISNGVSNALNIASYPKTSTPKAANSRSNAHNSFQVDELSNLFAEL